MTIPAINSLPVEALANGSSFEFPFAPLRVYNETQLRVYIKLDDATPAFEVFRGTGSDQYAVIGAFEEEELNAVSGAIVYPADRSEALQSPARIYVAPNLTISQQRLDLSNQGPYRPEVQELGFDYLTLICQQIQEQLDRTPKVSIGSGESGDDLIDLITEYRNETELFRDQSQAAQGEATVQAGLAGDAKDDAETARDFANAWASADEGVEVDDGVNPSGFSAFHYKEKTKSFFVDFNTWYLGPFSADPELDNQGDALQDGAMYFNTVAGIARIYKSGNWQNIDNSETNKTVGEFFWHLGTTPPDGAMVCNGQEVSDLYPDLKAFLVDQGSLFGTANGNPLLPDMETANRFIRAAGGSIDVGDLQDDAMQQITGSFINGYRDSPYSEADGAFTLSNGGGTGYAPSGTTSDRDEYSFDSANSPNARTADETRPVNIALLPCVQAFGAVNVEGIADLSELLNAIATQAEAEAGTDNTKLMTPLQTKWAIEANRGLAKAWVNFNGTGTVAIRDSYNVSSVTDNGTGDYTINFITPFATPNFALAGAVSRVGKNDGALSGLYVSVNDAGLASSKRIRTAANAGGAFTNTDHESVYIVFFGELS